MNNIKLSERLRKVANLVRRGDIVADIGTDHGYLPIYLIQNNISSHVIAMDVRKGPLEKARCNVQEYQVSDQIELRLSDGLEKLKAGEANTITICGMGGPLISSILEHGLNRIDSEMKLILSPQSEIAEFRQYLEKSGFYVINEHMLKEDGQYYFIMECQYTAAHGENLELSEQQTFMTQEEQFMQQVYYRYGKKLLENRNEHLHEYLLRERKLQQKVYDKLDRLEYKGDAVAKRTAQIQSDMDYIDRALQFYEK